jgi:hypothetical protein
MDVTTHSLTDEGNGIRARGPTTPPLSHHIDFHMVTGPSAAATAVASNIHDQLRSANAYHQQDRSLAMMSLSSAGAPAVGQLQNIRPRNGYGYGYSSGGSNKVCGQRPSNIL